MASLHDRKLDGKYTDYQEIQHFLNRILASLQYSSSFLFLFLGASYKHPLTQIKHRKQNVNVKSFLKRLHLFYNW